MTGSAAMFAEELDAEDSTVAMSDGGFTVSFLANGLEADDFTAKAVFIVVGVAICSWRLSSDAFLAKGLQADGNTGLRKEGLVLGAVTTCSMLVALESIFAKGLEVEGFIVLRKDDFIGVVALVSFTFPDDPAKLVSFAEGCIGLTSDMNELPAELLLPRYPAPVLFPNESSVVRVGVEGVLNSIGDDMSPLVG